MNTEELSFAYKVRHALNENLGNLPSDSLTRLASARKAALSRKKNDLGLTMKIVRRVLAGLTVRFSNVQPSWFARAGIALPAIVLIIGLTSIFYEEENQRIKDIAAIDAEMLADELPLDAYLDHGFNAYLAKEVE